jgi:glycine betaine/proline transport system substrate-binding protein
VVAGVAVALTLSATLAACGKSKEVSGGSGSGENAKTVTIGVLQGWAEDQVVSELWKQVLEKKGYTVTLKNVSTPGPLFTGVAGGDLDLFMDTWLPKTHKDYVDKYGSQMEDLGIWYDQATLDITVPQYMTDINSIADLKGKASQFDGKVVGIEPGAGLTKAAKEAISGYKLSDYTLQTSSTTAMLSALKGAYASKKPIVVTLWRPHWAYSQYKLKDLKDPKGLMGAKEKIHTYAHKGFSSNHKELAGWLKNFKLPDAQLASLENEALNQSKDASAGVTKWMNENQDFVKQMTARIRRPSTGWPRRQWQLAAGHPAQY